MSGMWLWAHCRTDAIAHHKFGNKYRFSDLNLAELAPGQLAQVVHHRVPAHLSGAGDLSRGLGEPFPQHLRMYSMIASRFPAPMLVLTPTAVP